MGLDRPSFIGVDFAKGQDQVGVCIWTPAGNEYLDLKSSEAARLQRDPEEFIGELLGVTVETLRDWYQYRARAYCAQILKGGRFCKCIVSSEAMGEPNSTLDIQTWMRFHRVGYCKLHNGW